MTRPCASSQAAAFDEEEIAAAEAKKAKEALKAAQDTALELADKQKEVMGSANDILRNAKAAAKGKGSSAAEATRKAAALTEEGIDWEKRNKANEDRLKLLGDRQAAG